ncbi:polyphenol oxidase, chloroplastic [Eucalyptus grandis]|uniref:polyphenol oxidase, chloroplastic n=1 Tax=Eucalyptus grandis TaxID=71139 RepID=UPI00192E783C|nr:polyphenol oxidase, chloroplastic [Eucalyptus grandis]
MASLPSPATTTAVGTTTSSFSSPVAISTYGPFFPKRGPASFYSKHRKPSIRRSTISCKALSNDDSEQNPMSVKLDRRNVLIGLGGFYGAVGLRSDPFALAEPISVPDFTQCGKVNPCAKACCPPPTTEVLDFKLPSSNSPTRVRPAAHLADEDYIAKYAEAIRLMKALPADDPRSFMQQANVHCAYCDGYYNQVGFPHLEVQVHCSWLFFPFHRYYLYFYEKILGSLIKDPTFALPYWNWDAPGGMKMPAMFTDPHSPLYDFNRNPDHAPPMLVDLNYNCEHLPPSNLIDNNLSIMYRQMVSSGKTAKLFLGHAYRAGDHANPGAGSIELMPHNTVHNWCGDYRQPNLEDMGILYSAARDPLFFAHHSNVDRMWTLWKTLGGPKRTDFTHPDWLNASFLFYDENKQAVRVKVKDCLETTNLGYKYQDVDIPWRNSKPVPRKIAIKVTETSGGIADVAEIPRSIAHFPVKLDKVVSTLVKRPKQKRSKKEKEEKEEVLVIEGIELESDAFVKFDVHINDEQASLSSPDMTEFAGSFVNVPHKHKPGKKMKTKLTLGITELLEDLMCEDDEKILVTLNPRYGGEDVIISNIKIEFVD